MENSLPCRKWHVHGPLLAMNCRTRLCLCPEPGRAMTSRPCPKTAQAPRMRARTGNERDHCIAYFGDGMGIAVGERTFVSFPAAQNADGGARHAQRSDHATAHGSEARESPARPSLHMARCMSLQGGPLPRCLALGDPAVAGSFLEPVCKSWSLAI